MNVTQIMATAVHMLNPGESLVTAARSMREADIGCVLVGSNGHLAGIVTDRDIVLRGIAKGNHASDMTVAEVMTRDPMFCSVDDTVLQAARIMKDNQVRRLPVLNAERTVVGIVSLGDICTHAPQNVAGELIETISTPERHDLFEVG